MSYFVDFSRNTKHSSLQHLRPRHMQILSLSIISHTFDVTNTFLLTYVLTFLSGKMTIANLLQTFESCDLSQMGYGMMTQQWWDGNKATRR